MMPPWAALTLSASGILIVAVAVALRSGRPRPAEQVRD
jgi:hypothetical protein